jgi:hypothetical protein
MSTHRARRIITVLACILLPSAATAQVAMPGARVRVVDAATSRPVMVGTLVRLVGDSVTIFSESNLASSSAYTVWAVGGPRRLEVRTAKHDQALVGALLGGLAGAAAGYAIASRTPDNCGNSFTMCIPPSSLGAMGGSLAGILVGGLIGKGFRSDEWRPVDRLPVRVGVVPSRQGALFTASFPF